MPFLANLHFFSSEKYSYMYSMTPKNFYSFFAYEYKKYTEFYADFRSVEKIWKKCTQKKLLAKNTLQISSIEEGKVQLSTLVLPITFFLANFLHFSEQFRKQRKILCYSILIPNLKFCEERVFRSY